LLTKKSTTLFFAFFWIAFVTFLLCIPGKKLPQIWWVSMFQVDKIIHLILFFVLSMLFCSVAYSINKTQKWFWGIAFICSVYGLGMEFVQENFIANRSFDVWDIVADTIGSFAFLVFLNLKPQFYK
jgi:VanZ family protein